MEIWQRIARVLFRPGMRGPSSSVTRTRLLIGSLRSGRDVSGTLIRLSAFRRLRELSLALCLRRQISSRPLEGFEVGKNAATLALRDQLEELRFDVQKAQQEAYFWRGVAITLAIANAATLIALILFIIGKLGAR